MLDSRLAQAVILYHIHTPVGAVKTTGLVEMLEGKALKMLSLNMLMTKDLPTPAPPVMNQRNG